MSDADAAVQRIGWTIGRKSMTAAEAEAEQAVADYPESPDCLAVLALTRLWRGKLEEAISTIARALALGPQSGVVLAIDGEILTFGGRKGEGLAQVERALKISPDHWTVLRQAGLFSLAGRPEVAREMIERELALDSENPSAHNHMCNYLMTANDLGGLERYLASAPESYKHACGYHRHLGSLAIRKKDFAAAERHYRDAVAADSESGMAWRQLATILAHTGRPDEAARAAEFALQCNSRNSIALNALAVVARNRGDRKKEAEYRRRAKEAVPGLRGSEGVRQANDAIRQGDRQKQIEQLSTEPADELPMQRGIRLNLLCTALRQAKEYERLAEVLTALEADGDRQEDYYRGKAAVDVERGQPDAALESLDAGIAATGASLTLFADKVAILGQLGRTEETDALVKAIGGMDIPSCPAAAETVMILLDAGFEEEGKALLTRAERLAPGPPLKLIRFTLTLKERPEAAQLLAERFRAAQERRRARANPISKLIDRFKKPKT